MFHVNPPLGCGHGGRRSEQEGDGFNAGRTRLGSLPLAVELGLADKLACHNPPALDTGCVGEGRCRQQPLVQSSRATSHAERRTVHPQPHAHRCRQRMQRGLRHDVGGNRHATTGGILRERAAAGDAACLAGSGDHAVPAAVGCGQRREGPLYRPHRHHRLLVGMAKKPLGQRWASLRIRSRS